MLQSFLQGMPTKNLPLEEKKKIKKYQTLFIYKN